MGGVRDIKDKLARERTVDLEKVLKAYTLSVIAFKHKAKIIDALNAGYDILNNAIEQQVNNAGEPIKDNFGCSLSKNDSMQVYSVVLSSEFCYTPVF